MYKMLETICCNLHSLHLDHFSLRNERNVANDGRICFRNFGLCQTSRDQRGGEPTIVARESAKRRDDAHLRGCCFNDHLLVRQFDLGEPTGRQAQGCEWQKVPQNPFRQAARLYLAIGIYVSTWLILSSWSLDHSSTFPTCIAAWK